MQDEKGKEVKPFLVVQVFTSQVKFFLLLGLKVLHPAGIQNYLAYTISYIPLKSITQLPKKSAGEKYRTI